MPPFSSPQGNAPQTLAVLWSLSVIAFIFVLLRLYTRFKVVEAIGIDDHLFNGAFILLLVYCILITISAFYGFGLIRDDVPDPWDRSLVIILTGAGQTVIGVAVWLSKSSLAFFLLRLFGSCGRRVRWTIIIPPILLGIFVTAGLLTFWLECRPISYLWDRLNPNGVCGDNAVYLTLIASALSFLCDFLYAALPWFVLKNLQIPRGEKNVLLCSMSLGVFAGACGVMRAVTLPSMAEGEYMRDRAALLMWHAAEMTVTMVCIGVPVCRPLWKQWVNKLVSGDRTQHTSEQYFGQQRYSIGGSDMWASEGKDSKPRSRPRKWSDAPKGWSEPSDSNAAVNKIQPIKLVPLEAIKSESTASANGMHSPDSWSTWNPSNNK